MIKFSYAKKEKETIQNQYDCWPKRESFSFNF